MSSNFSQIFTSFTRFSSKLANTKSRNSSQHRILAVSITLVILKISIIVRQLSQKKNYILLVRKIGRSKCLIKVKTLLAWLVWTLEKVFKIFPFYGLSNLLLSAPLGETNWKNVQKHKKTRFFQFLIKVEYFYTVGNLQVARYVIGWDKCCVPLREKNVFFRKSEKKHTKCIRFAQGYALSAQNKIFHLRKGAQLLCSRLELVKW